ncbi:MAG TPA: M20/M25/M40 family metallo-hydrolase [Thermoanaerobaculia bacterium]|nr:M20/M25/M40 family metallo-hydrolase [Thermoanaerobaculia bacterium]
MRIDTDYLEKTLAGLVRINSINPFFTQGEEQRTDESAIAAYLAGELERLGMRVTSHEPEPGRVSVVGTLPGTGGGRSLLLYGHMDTVNVEGMAAPFSAEVRDGRMYGRGTYDMKGGLAACVAAAKAVIDSGVRLAGDLSVVGVADEEVASLGLLDLLKTLKADACIVTEATELDVCVAHKGFCWFEVETFGRAAHGSRFLEGVDANLRMGRFLGHLDRLERQLRESPGHPLVGPPTLHAATLRGGTGPSTYAAHCRLEVERRTIPGETEAGTLAEMQGILDRLKDEDPAFQGSVRTLLARPPFEVAPEAAIVQAVDRAAAEVLGRRPATIGHTFWMDASLFAEAGIETVVIGPVGAGAHAVEEWVDLDSVAKLADILARAAVAHCG